MKRSSRRFFMVMLLSITMTVTTFLALNGLHILVQAEAGLITPFAGAARVRVAHLAPFDNTITGTAVNVLVNGSPILTDFKFASLSPGYVDVPAGLPLSVQVIPTGGTSALISKTISLTETEYTIAAIGNGGSDFQKFDLLLLNDDNSPPQKGSGKLRVVHAAPFSSLPSVTEVDVSIDSTPILTGFGYTAVSEYLQLPAGQKNVEVKALGGLLTVMDTMVILDGSVLTVFAIGDNVRQPVDVLPVIDRIYSTRLYLPTISKN